MKDIVSRITESNNQNGLTTVQSEADDKAMYVTYDFSKVQSKYKKGFIVYNDEINSVILIAYNKYTDIGALTGDVDADDTYKQYDNIKVGHSGTVGTKDGVEENVTRIW